MGSATEKQILALKRFAKNTELSREILKGVEFRDLDKQQASDLITRCLERNGKATGAERQDKIRFSQSFRDGYRIYKVTTLTEEEINEVREDHKRHCKRILDECRDEYPGEPAMQLAVFDKRCDKIYTWIQQARDEKIKKQRENSDSD